MKALKKVIGFLALFLTFGGAVVFFWQYFRNKQMFMILAANSVVKGSLPIIQKMLMALLAVIAGLLLCVLYMRIALSVRKSEKEKRAAIKAAQQENEEINKQLRKEAEEARREAEQAKKENDELRMTFSRKEEEENTEVPENE